MKIYRFLAILASYFFFQSAAHSLDNFPHKNIVFADSCVNPSNIVLWKDAPIRLARYQYDYQSKELSRLDTTIELVYSNYIQINYQLNVENILVDRYVFNKDGYRLMYRGFIRGATTINDFNNLTTGNPTPFIYRCTSNSLAALTINPLIEVFEKNQRAQEASKLEDEKISRLKYEREIQARNKSIKMMCKGRPRIQRNILEQLSRQIKVAPDSISINRVEYVDNRIEYAPNIVILDSCKAIFYTPNGACSANVELDESGVIIRLEEKCK